jgi:hypothetical protein
MTPTTIFSSQNQFTILADTDDTDNDDDAPPPQQHSCAFAATTLPPGLPQTSPQALNHQNSALSDSGATSHFLVEGAHAINIQPDPDPITVTLPDGRTIQSTHTCNLDIPWIRGSATQAHIIPGLTHSSLVATAKFCDAGYTVVFDALECRIYDGWTRSNNKFMAPATPPNNKTV